MKKKSFAGFTPQQQHILLQKAGYKGPLNQAEMDKFIASSPSAQSTLGRATEMAQNRFKKAPVQMAEGGFVGMTPYQIYSAGSTVGSGDTSGADQLFESATQAAAATTTPTTTTTEATPTATTTTASASGIPTATELHAEIQADPTSVVTPSNVAQITNEENQNIDPSTGQQAAVEGPAIFTVGEATQAQAADATETNTVDPTLLGDSVNTALDGLEAEQGMVSEQGTVRGQLESLMADFEGGGTPPWASGAMREAMSVMQKRGMGASSMAGMAVVQSAMESAIGIASQDAATVAQFEMQNLTNRQQTAIFKTQQTIAGMFSDQAADNAAKQFNAASQNQTDQFFAELETTVSRFNAEQINATMRFNAGELNEGEKFVAQLKAQREQFNAGNSLIIAQANAQWRQQIATTNTAAQNEANMQYAATANGFTQRSIDEIWQRERDLMNFAYASSESAQDRSLQLLLADKATAQANSQIEASKDSAKTSALGFLAGRLLFG